MNDDDDFPQYEELELIPGWIDLVAVEEPCTCGKMLKQLKVWGDYVLYQHGDNPEHTLRMTGLETVASTSPSFIQDRVRAWLDEVHNYESETTDCS